MGTRPTLTYTGHSPIMDVHIRTSSLTSLPTKVLSMVPSARPILAVTPADSEIAHLVQDTRCGLNLPPEQPKLLAEAILSLRHQGDQLLEMGRNGRSQLEARFSRARCVGMCEQLLLALLRTRESTIRDGA